jgi:L-ascorbate metabolism protein UlaG (beta-lactamase superfamily)
MTPEQAVQATEDLKAKALLPAHVGRFSIGRHAWREPFERISRASTGKPYRLMTPAIGHPLLLDGDWQAYAKPWWTEAQRAGAPSDAGGAR